MPVGGARPGAGRKPGKVSKAKRDLAELAKGHAEAALRALVDIAKNGESESARVSAANAILDRSYGRPFQAQNPAGEAGDNVADALRDIANKLPG